MSARAQHLAPAAIERELRELVPRVIRREKAQVIAFRLGNVPVRTVENWQAGSNLPSTAHFFALADLFPELRDKSLEWLAAGFGVEPLDEARLIHELQQFLSARRGKP